MNEQNLNSKILSNDELEQVSGGRAPGISIDQAQKYFEAGVNAHLEMQAIFYYKSFRSLYSEAQRQKMKQDFLQRFDHELEESRFYSAV